MCVFYCDDVVDLECVLVFLVEVLVQQELFVVGWCQGVWFDVMYIFVFCVVDVVELQLFGVVGGEGDFVDDCG